MSETADHKRNPFFDPFFSYTKVLIGVAILSYCAYRARQEVKPEADFHSPVLSHPAASTSSPDASPCPR